MALQITTDYDNASNFTFDTDDIEIAVDKAQLKIQLFPETPFSEDFADDTGHTYDSDKAEFVGGVVRQKDQTPANSIFASDYTTVDLTWRKDGGSLTGTLNGVPTISAGKLVCTGAQGVSYTRVSSALETWKVKYTPNYTGAPPSNINILSSSGTTSDRCNITHSPSGDNIRITLRDSSGVSLLADVIGASGINLQAGTTYELEFVIDSVSGYVRLFIDGAVYGTLNPGAWTRGGVSKSYIIGADAAIYNQAEASFDDYIIFDDVQHTGTYTPGYSIPALLYAESSVTLPVFTYSGPGDLVPAGAPTSTETGTPRYILQGKYWDGDSWEDSDGSYAQSTSKANIIANLGTFPDSGLSTITVIVTFGDSNTQSSVDQIDFNVAGEGYSQDAPNIKPNSFIQADGLDSFSATIIETGSDEVRFIVETRNAPGGNSTYWYHDGADWVNSDLTFAQSNTLADLNTNLSSLDISSGKYVRIPALLYSDDGYSTPSIEESILTYNFFASEPEPSRVIVYGWLREANDDPIQGTVKFQVLAPFEHTGVLVPKSQVSATTNVNGYWEIEIYETATISKSYNVEISYTEPFGKTAKFPGVVVPNQDSVNFNELIVA